MNIEKDNTAESFDELYMRYNGLVFGICMSVLHNEHDAQDISQEVFIRLYEWWNRINDAAKIKGWLCIVARNMSLNYIQKNKKIIAADEPDAEYCDPEELYLEKERRNIIKAAIEGLDRKYAEVIELKYALDFTVREIAIATGTQIPTVYTRLRRAEKALCEILGKEEL